MGIMVQDLLIRVRADTTQAEAGLGALRGGAMLGLVAAAGFAGAAFVKMGMDAQTQLSIVAGLTNSSKAQMDYYTSSLEGMGAKFGMTLSEAAKGLYYVVSAGYQGADAINVLTTAMQHSAATGVPLQDVANGLTSAMNAYAASASEATRYSDILTTAITYGKQTTADFANNVSKAALMAASAHVPFTQLAAAEAALTEKGEPANRAFTELSFMMSKIAVPSAKEMAKSVSALGGHLDATKYQSADLMGKLLLLRNSTGLNEDAFLKLVGGTRSARGALGLLSDGGAAYNKILTAMANNSGVTAKAFEIHTHTMAYGFDQVKAAVSNAAFEFVKFISPKVVPFLTGIAQALTEVTTNTQKYAPLIGGIAVAATVLLTVAMWNLAAAVIAATWPFLLAAAAIGLVVAGLIYAYQHWTGFRVVVDTVRDALGRFFSSIGPWLSQFGTWVQSVIKWFVDLGTKIALGTKIGIMAVQGMVAAIGNWFSQLGTNVHNFLTGIANFFTAGWNLIVSIVANAINTVIGWFNTAYNHSYLFQGIVDNIRAAFNGAKAFIIGVWSAITGWLSSTWNGLVSAGAAAFNRIHAAIDQANNLIAGVVRSVWGAITGFLNSQWNVIRGAAQAAWNAFVGLITAAQGRASSATHGVANAITSPLQAIVGVITGIGRSIIAGLIGGIQSMLGALGGIIAHVAGMIKDGLVHLLGIHSPSTVTAYMGAMLGQGLIQGLLAQDVPGQIADHMSKIGRVAGTGITVGVTGGVSSATIGATSAVSLQGGGSSGAGAMVIHVHSHNYLDGREVTESVLRHTPAVARLATGRRDA